MVCCTKALLVTTLVECLCPVAVHLICGASDVLRFVPLTVTSRW